MSGLSIGFPSNKCCRVLHTSGSHTNKVQILLTVPAVELEPRIKSGKSKQHGDEPWKEETLKYDGWGNQDPKIEGTREILC